MKIISEIIWRFSENESSYFVVNLSFYQNVKGAWGSVVVKVPGSIPDDVTGFFSDILLPTYHGPGIDSAPSEYEYQEHFLGVKVAGA
jgi:hypothetical protein